jgi:hypothetical protein
MRCRLLYRAIDLYFLVECLLQPSIAETEYSKNHFLGLTVDSGRCTKNKQKCWHPFEFGCCMAWCGQQIQLTKAFDTSQKMSEGLVWTLKWRRVSLRLLCTAVLNRHVLLLGLGMIWICPLQNLTLECDSLRTPSLGSGLECIYWNHLFQHVPTTNVNHEALFTSGRFEKGKAS